MRAVSEVVIIRVGLVRCCRLPDYAALIPLATQNRGRTQKGADNA
jgi:hypothetical protein